jgi:hypothetical protein
VVNQENPENSSGGPILFDSGADTEFRAFSKEERRDGTTMMTQKLR